MIAASAATAVRKARLAAGLEGRSEQGRLVLALLLVERLTVAEAADALGISPARVARSYRESLAALDRIAAGLVPAGHRPRRPAAARLRRAS